jgi:hypothetical protein
MNTRSEIEQSHLSDEQFADLLLGTNPSAVQEHLKSCPRCAQEAERVSSAIGSFEQHSRHWAEHRASTRPVLTPVRPPAFEWLYRPQAWTAAALAIALAVGVTINVRNHRVASQAASGSQTVAVLAPAVQAPAAQTQTARSAAVQSTVAQAEPAPNVSPATLKADNDLLSAIDGELRANEATPAGAYGLNVAVHGVRTKSNGMINE